MGHFTFRVVVVPAEGRAHGRDGCGTGGWLHLQECEWPHREKCRITHKVSGNQAAT